MSEITELTAVDEEHLERLRKKHQSIRDRVIMCVGGHCNGAYIWGEGGIGKSYAVIDQLSQINKKYILHNTRLSAPAFFKSIEKHSTDLHVVEDVEDIFNERGNMNLLRSALWGQKDGKGRQQRIVTYGVHPTERVVMFEGQIIFTGNRPLQDIPELRAMASRIPVLHLAVTRPEILALMKKMCQQEYKTDKGVLSPSQCAEVLAFFLDIYPADRVFDIRIMIRCLDDRLGVKTLGKKFDICWKELITSQVSGKAELPVTRKEQISRETTIALELSRNKLSTKELRVEWGKRTGRQSLDSYYRRLRTLR